MNKFWVIANDSAKAEISISGGVAILKNRYLYREIELAGALTRRFEDGDGVSMIAPYSCGGITVGVDGKNYVFDSEDIVFEAAEIISSTEKKFDYAKKSYSTHDFPYPTPGKTLRLTYRLDKLSVILSYELFDGMPVIRAGLNIVNHGAKTVSISYSETEKLAVAAVMKHRLYLESDYTGGNGTGPASDCAIFYDGDTVSAHFDMGPDADIVPGESFRGMQVYTLVCQSESYESRANEVQNMYRRVAPWVNEAPKFLHLISDDSKTLRESADMLSKIGYDMIIQSFGSGIDLESTDPAYIERVRADYDYVHEKGIVIGGYTLAIIRDYSPMNHDCATNGDHSQISRCLCTKWSEGYWNRVVDFLQKTGSDFIEIDGPYHFYTCTGNKPGQTEHLHKGLSDSRYMQWLRSTIEIYIRLKNLGVYVNTPDWFFLSGTNKCAVGYEEISFSQPRVVQLVCNRIYNYLGTYRKTPSMGWGFLPVEEYHGGGSAAKFEPLTENLCDYDWALAQATASGVWPCIRGRRLYDTELCRKTVKYWSDVSAAHRTLLNSNTVHVYPPRPNDDFSASLDIDVILQENNTTTDKLFLMVFNQTSEKRTKTLILPAFYTGLTAKTLPPIAPATGSFDAVKIPNFGSWPPIYPKNLENKLADYEAAAPSGIRMSLYEYDDAQRSVTADIDVNGNLILTLTLEPMSYTYFVGYEEGVRPAAMTEIPEGKPFGLKPAKAELLTAQKIVKIDFDAVAAAQNVPEILVAMGIPQTPHLRGEKILLRTETYGQISDCIRLKHTPDSASNILFALAQLGLHTVTSESVNSNEVWLEPGWDYCES